MRIVGISGVEKTVSPTAAAIGWTLIIGTTLAIFVGTLMLRPGKGR